MKYLITFFMSFLLIPLNIVLALNPSDVEFDSIVKKDTSSKDSSIEIYADGRTYVNGVINEKVRKTKPIYSLTYRCKVDTLPFWFKELTDLKTISLIVNNTFNFQDFFQQIRYCKNIQQIQLSCDSINFPYEFVLINDLDILKTIRLDRVKRITFNLKSLKELTKSINLDLTYSYLSNLPNELSNYKNLSEIHLPYSVQNMNIDSVLDVLINCKEIKSISFPEGMSEFPKKLCEFKKIEYIQFMYCKIFEFPDCIRDFTNLKLIHFRNSKLTDTDKKELRRKFPNVGFFMP